MPTVRQSAAARFNMSVWRMVSSPAIGQTIRALRGGGQLIPRKATGMAEKEFYHRWTQMDTDEPGMRIQTINLAPQAIIAFGR
jgi:hypothetical protein